MDDYSDQRASASPDQCVHLPADETTDIGEPLSDAYQRIAALTEQNRIYKRRLQAQELQMQQTEFDDLTGLYNMRAFCRRVSQQLREEVNAAYLIVRWDIDRFKIFNDVLGVAAGDRLLRDIGLLLHRNHERYGIYAHLEADHFVHCLPAGTNLESLFQDMFRWLATYPADFRLTPRVGVYVVDDPELAVSIMCDRALLALRSIKGNYQQRLAYYDESLREKLLEEQQLVNELSSALQQQQFKLFFQPQYNYSTGEIIGAEALVRWNHPTRGLLLPDKFIPLFEKKRLHRQSGRIRVGAGLPLAQPMAVSQ